MPFGSVLRNGSHRRGSAAARRGFFATETSTQYSSNYPVLRNRPL